MPRRSRSLCYLSVDSLLIQVNATMYIASLIHNKKKDATHEYPEVFYMYVLMKVGNYPLPLKSSVAPVCPCPNFSLPVCPSVHILLEDNG